jgi:hypothetical protein
VPVALTFPIVPEGLKRRSRHFCIEWNDYNAGIFDHLVELTDRARAMSRR